MSDPTLDTLPDAPAIDSLPKPRTPTLRQVLESAERAQQRVATWPDWKRKFSAPSKRTQHEEID